jgi:glucosamine-6-phosphate deaminase
MEVVVLPDEREGAELVARAVVDLLQGNPAAVLGLATGSSPSPVYALLVDRYRRGEVSFAGAAAFTLDEYLGLPAGHPQAYRQVIDRELVAHVDFAAGAVRSPTADGDDVAAACGRYEQAITECGGIDLQLLGIGSDGHLAFNEPGSSLASRTRVKTLTAQTRADNARFFDDPDDVPRHVITQGLGTIRDARHLVLMASGAGKAEAVAATVEGPVSASCPASVLQLHPHVTVVLDPTAASRLRLLDYYRQVWLGKPSWQGI